MNKNNCVLFYEKLNTMEDKEYIENFLVYNTATVIAGIKPASTVTLSKIYGDLYTKWIKYGKDFIKKICLNYIDLRENEKAVIILIFSKDLLISHVNKEKNKNFLINLGYSEEMDIDRTLTDLKKRYDLYHCPHELGIFLGIPLSDVKDFMEYGEKRCLLCGYWKVYNDYYDAKMTFNRYDEIRERTVNNLIKGNNSEALVVCIRKNI